MSESSTGKNDAPKPSSEGAVMGWGMLVLVAGVLGFGLARSLFAEYLGTRPEVTFEAERAWNDLEALVALGPRVAGTDGAERTRELIADRLRSAGLEPVREEFRAATPKGPKQMANLYVDVEAPPIDGEPAPMFVLCAHFDTKDIPDFVGANDGGSATAVLLELARCLAAAPQRAATYRLLFVDGEESVRPEWLDPDNCYGSREHVRNLRRSGDIENVYACILLDMVGDKNLKLTRELYSDDFLTDMFFEAAREGGYNLHVGGRAQRIHDDHESFLRANIPSLNLIDFEYGPDNAYWHSLDDTLENCSKKSLEVIGNIVLLGLPKLEAYYDLEPVR